LDINKSWFTVFRRTFLTQPNLIKQTATCSHFNVLYNPRISRHRLIMIC
jgi:hypothetical protein